MFLTLLLSVFLLALVASARPVAPELGSEYSQTAVALGTLQNIPESWQAPPLEPVLPFVQDKSSSSGNQELRRLHNGVANVVDASVGDTVQQGEGHHVDEARTVQASTLKSMEARRDLPESGSPTVGASPFVVVMYSCLAALLSVTGGVCMRSYIRNRALRAQIAWELLPRTDEIDAYSDSEDYILDSTPEDADARLLASPALLDAKHHPNPWLSTVGSLAAREILDAEFADLITFEDKYPKDAASAADLMDDVDLVEAPADHVTKEDPEDVNEFFDASTDLPEPTPLPLPTPLPVITISQVSTVESGSSDPPLLSLSPQPLALEISSVSRPQSPAYRSQRMRETNLAPISRPSWSLRANQDASLYVPPPSLSLDIRLSPLAPVKHLPSFPSLAPSSPSSAAFALAVPASKPRRAFRSPVPEFDIALAMQLRPGLGPGADAAWMVRFIMTIFGFLSVLWNNHSTRFAPLPSLHRRLANSS
ncbi:hypothetical protein FIBSPDRAFT_1047364 [Athelia psychrophila]|uniref:Transmembrane protein n=1 Tax=Athelia psychrophila TaxID=1759441 RepID=A0A166FEY9_9AGAM|nr:hypothetical protein FIBSPDRAFT_1047364 [Fibularhizoctonia sp. CBS 109695]